MRVAVRGVRLERAIDDGAEIAREVGLEHARVEAPVRTILMTSSIGVFGANLGAERASRGA